MSGLSLNTAARRAVSEMAHSGRPCSVTAINTEGEYSIQSTARVFYTALGSSDNPPQPFLCPTSIPILPQHFIYNGARLIAGLSRYPTTPGHTLAILRQSNVDLFSLKRSDFTRIMLEIVKVAITLRRFYNVGRCALVAEGGNSLSILPLHGLSREWKPINNNMKEFHKTFPGYISSRDGPQMNNTQLDNICSTIQKVSGISQPFKCHFQGDKSDKNLFAQIVRGKLQQWRVWEDDQHIAFLTPFANTPGFTVLVPRAHLSSDIFSLDEQAYSKLVAAAYTVAGILKNALGIGRCGMIFEGFEIDYAHVKLIPIHEAIGATKASFPSFPLRESAHEEKYQGYVTSLNGPLVKDMKSLTSAALSIRKSFQGGSIRPPKSWQSPSSHTSTVIEDPWYGSVLAVQDGLFHASVGFFKRRLGYKYSLVPATIDAISSPMGLGSDSTPVPISILGQNTHLADSMQFVLEYFLRIEDDLPGVQQLVPWRRLRRDAPQSILPR